MIKELAGQENEKINSMANYFEMTITIIYFRVDFSQQLVAVTNTLVCKVEFNFNFPPQ